MSQGELREGHGADSRLAEAADRLRERIKVREGSGGTLPENGKSFPNIEIEVSVAESYAKENGLWIPLEDTFTWKRLSGGNENDVFLLEESVVYKINNLINDGGSIVRLLERILLHNRYFPETAYDLVGFTGIDDRSIFPILKQMYIRRGMEASASEVESYMLRLGFCKTGDYAYANNEVSIDDLRPRNVLKDSNGVFYVIDAGLRQIPPAKKN